MWWNDVRCENRFNVMWDELCDAQCNLKPTNYVKTTALLMWKAHTHAWNQWHISCTQSYQSPEEKRWEGRVKWYCGRKIYICYKVWCGMVCCMMWNVCGLDDYRVLSGAEWWWRRACGVKWWREIAVWCDFKCFAVWIYKVMCSIQSSLLFLYYVVFSVVSVQYCLCVSRIQCTECWVSLLSVSSVL